MVDIEQRPILRLAASLGCVWKNIEKSEMESDQASADLQELFEREVGSNFTSEDANLVVFGSLGRREWIDYQNDLDWTYLVEMANVSQDISQLPRKLGMRSLHDLDRTSTADYSIGSLSPDRRARSET